MIGGIIAVILNSDDTECDTGYVKLENVCVDMCEGINCGIGGTCSVGNCTCQIGYANIENVCKETCALSPCEELITISFLFFVR